MRVDELIGVNHDEVVKRALIEYRAAQEQDWAGARELIQRFDLPLEGLEASRLKVAVDGDQLVGTAAMEIHGPQGLLRSVAVTPERQGMGIGRQLVEMVEREAREKGLKELVLLTMTAPGFFERLGFTAVERCSVEGPVTQSVEFTVCCPDSAACLIKRLG